MKKKTIEINEHTEAHKGHAENKKVAANLLKYLLQIKFQSKTDASKNLIWLLAAIATFIFSGRFCFA